VNSKIRVTKIANWVGNKN